MDLLQTLTTSVHKNRKVQFRTFSASCLDSANNAEVGDTTPLERDEKTTRAPGLAHSSRNMTTLTYLAMYVLAK